MIILKSQAMDPRSFDHPQDYMNAFAAKYPGWFPTYFSSFQSAWVITYETEKAVKIDDENWLPKSQIMIEDGKVTGVKTMFYNRLKHRASRRFGY